MSGSPAKLPPKLSVGVIGIGAFGSKIALRLLWTDFPGLQIYDTDDLTPRFFSNNYGPGIWMPSTS